MRFMTGLRFGAGVAAALVGVSLATAPASAQGFFDQLFGTAPSAPTYNMPPTDPEFFPPSSSSPRLHHKKHAAVEDKPVKQTPTDLMHDKTLRVGDAVMMKDGLRVYNGPESSKHADKQFVPLETARHVSAAEREKLAAVDVTPADSVVEGRSATAISKGVQITDAQGRSIRYVGP